MMFYEECVICGADSKLELKISLTDYKTMATGECHSFEGKYCIMHGKERLSEFTKRMVEKL